MDDEVFFKITEKSQIVKKMKFKAWHDLYSHSELVKDAKQSSKKISI